MHPNFVTGTVMGFSYLLHFATLTNVRYILLGNMLAQISVKGQKVNISGIAGHTVHHSCPTLPLEQENNHRQYGNEYIGCVFIKLFFLIADLLIKKSFL